MIGWGASRQCTGWMLATLTAATLVVGGCASSPGGVNDPWEGMNRGVFRFNEGADRYVIEPAAKGWDFVMPDPLERAIDRFFDNVGFPVKFVNDLLQAKPVAAAQDLSRFVINTTLGVAGFFDPATEFGIEGHDEDFGQTLGYWGVPPGPYLVLPIIGPSSPRDTVGLVADSAGQVYPYFVAWWVSSAITATDLLNRRSLALDEIAAERESALDLYAAVRNAWVSYRENQVRDREEQESDRDDDLYSDPEDDDAASD